MLEKLTALNNEYSTSNNNKNNHKKNVYIGDDERMLTQPRERQTSISFSSIYMRFNSITKPHSSINFH